MPAVVDFGIRMSANFGQVFRSFGKWNRQLRSTKIQMQDLQKAVQDANASLLPAGGAAPGVGTRGAGGSRYKGNYSVWNGRPLGPGAHWSQMAVHAGGKSSVLAGGAIMMPVTKRQAQGGTPGGGGGGGGLGMARAAMLTNAQAINLMRIQNAPTRNMRSIALASQTLRSFSMAVKEVRQVWDRWHGKPHRLRVSTQGAVKQLQGVVKEASAAGRQIHESLSARIIQGMELFQHMGGHYATEMFGPDLIKKSIEHAASFENARVTFDALLGDGKSVEDLLKRITEYSATTPFNRADVIEGSKRLLTITGHNVDENERLFKLSAQIAALRPGSTVEDVARGMVSAAVGEFDILKSTFGILLNAKMFQGAGAVGGKEYVAAVTGEIEKQLKIKTGGRDLVAALGQTLTGQTSSLSDLAEMTMEVIGDAIIRGFGIKEFIGGVSKIVEQLRSAITFVFDDNTMYYEGSDTMLQFAHTVRDVINGLSRLKSVAGEALAPVYDWFESLDSRIKRSIFGGILAGLGAGGVLGTLSGGLVAGLTGIVGAATLALSPLASGLLPAIGGAIASVVSAILPLSMFLGVVALGFMLVRRRGEGILDTVLRLSLGLWGMVKTVGTLAAVFLGSMFGAMWPKIKLAIDGLMKSVYMLQVPFNQFFDAISTSGGLVTMEQMAILGEYLGWVLGEAIGMGATIASMGIEGLARGLGVLAPWFKPTISDIMRVGRAMIGLITGTGNAWTSLKTILLGAVDLVTLPFRFVIEQVFRLVADTITKLGEMVSPLSSTLSGMFGSVAEGVNSAADSVREGFLSTANMSYGGEITVKLSDDTVIKADTPVKVNVDGTTVAESLVRTEVRSRNSGRGGDPVTPEEMGFVLEGGTRIRTVDIMEVASRS